MPDIEPLDEQSMAAFGLNRALGPWVRVVFAGREMPQGLAAYTMEFVGRELAVPADLPPRGWPLSESWQSSRVELHAYGDGLVLVAGGLPDLGLHLIRVQRLDIAASREWRWSATAGESLITVGNPGSRRRRQLVERADLLIADKLGRGHPRGREFAAADFEARLEGALRQVHMERLKLTRQNVATLMKYVDTPVFDDNLRTFGIDWKRDIKTGRWLAATASPERNEPGF